MCVKSCKNSPFLKPSTTLNPRAQEWRPPQLDNQILPVQSHLLFPPHSQPAAAPPPPQTAVQVVSYPSLPPHKLAWQIPAQLPYFYFPHTGQGLIPYPPCTRPQIAYHSTPFSFPANGRFHEATPPIFGGAMVKMLESGFNDKVEKPAVVKSRKWAPRIWRDVKSYGADEKAVTRRQEWRPRKSESDNAVAGGCATPSPPCNFESKPVSAASTSGKPLSSSKTTVMIKNIPNQLRRDSMLEFLDQYCNVYSLECDFFYLPMDFRKKDNLGYAFVNFTTADAALKFKEVLQNYKWQTIKTEKGLFTSKKICEITWARIQGKEGLIRRFQNSNFACEKLDFLPVVFDPPRNGSNTTKPAPPIILGRLSKPSKIF